MNQSKNKSRKVFLVYDKSELLAFLHSMNQLEIPLSNSIIVSDKPDFLPSINTPAPPVMAQGKVNQCLGQELEHLFYDATDDFSPNAFAAIIGCLVGGGNLVLLLPKMIKDLANVNDGISTSQNMQNACLKRLVSEFIHFQSSTAAETWLEASKTEIFEPNKSETLLTSSFFEQQANAIEMIKRVSLGHANRPLVLTASRGRGKSASLGVAAAELVFEKQKKIVVTSPLKANLDIFYSHFKNRLKELFNLKSRQKTTSECSFLEKNVRFLSLDNLIVEKSINDFLIVEEAGAIPVQILKQISNRATRVVYSTTTDGYEGNGQGFKIRFQDFLDSNFRQWKSCQLTLPARYSQNDPIEKAVNNALLFSNQPVTFNFKRINLEKVIYTTIVQKELSTNEVLLKQIYNLLLTAHYQTRPSDLERLLSDKNIMVYIASYNNQVLSTSLVLQEGSLSKKQCAKIEQGKLRLAGHLLPQSLMAHQGVINAGSLKYWRIMRIATHFQFRNDSLATHLIDHIKKEALASSVEILGTSFSLQNIVVNFWYKQGFKCNRIGLKKDSSTGELSCEFLFLAGEKTNAYNPVYSKAIASFNRSFVFYLKTNYRDIEVDVLIQVLTKQITNNTINPIHSEHELIRYIEKARSFEMVEWHLSQFMEYYLASSKIKFDGLSGRQKTLAFKKVLQNATWKQVIKQLNYSGKKEASSEMRKVFGLLIKPTKINQL